MKNKVAVSLAGVHTHTPDCWMKKLKNEEKIEKNNTKKDKK